MKHFEFSPFGIHAIIIAGTCPTCGDEVESDEILIPSPDYSAETSSESEQENEGFIFCEECDKEYNISVFSSFGGGMGHIEDWPSDHHVMIEEIPDVFYDDLSDTILSNTSFFETFRTELKSLNELNEIKISSISANKTLKRQIYIGIIGIMETYLSDAFINTVLNNQFLLEKFVSTFKDFRDRQLALSEIFTYYNDIKSTCKKAMLGVIYHNLPKVKEMYKDALNVNFGDISLMYKAVLIRHDLVHRNGKTKEGSEVSINKKTIDDLITQTESFINNIDAQLIPTKNELPF